MKRTIALVLSYGIALTAASSQPELQWDPDTISTCAEWFDNGDSDTCESIRSLFGISPEEFHTWNPSVGIDCKPWRYQSYCILTKERLASLSSTTTAAAATTTITTTSSTHAPSPTSWNALGCYTDDDPKYPVLEKLVSSADSALQIKSCEDTCWKASNGTVLYAGVKQGNQCWCGSFVGGQTSRNQKDCNSPCSGNKNEMCGGKERINVFEPVTTTASPKTTATATTTASPKTTATATTNAITTSTQSSGASKNRKLF